MIAIWYTSLSNTVNPLNVCYVIIGISNYCVIFKSKMCPVLDYQRNENICSVSFTKNNYRCIIYDKSVFTANGIDWNAKVRYLYYLCLTAYLNILEIM